MAGTRRSPSSKCRGTAPCRLASIILALLLAATLATAAPAITINLDLDDENKNPSYDQFGTRMYNVVRDAADIWESLLLSPGTYNFQIEWDDDLGSDILGLSSPGGGIEFNPIFSWYLDLSPLNNNEFDFDDADDDGDSDGHDFLAWQRQFGSAPPSAATTDAVPEPKSRALVTVGLFSCAFAIRSRRRRGSLA